MKRHTERLRAERRRHEFRGARRHRQRGPVLLLRQGRQGGPQRGLRCICPAKQAAWSSNTSGRTTRRDGGAPGPRANHHPTVKPTDLMRYLCRLVTPKGGIVLDPFMGSGSTGKAAMLEGFASSAST
jgi:hypothetical protein